MDGSIMNDDFFYYHYSFLFNNGTKKEFIIKLDQNNLNLVKEKMDYYPSWVNLIAYKCPRCTLKDENHENCPIAENLVDLIENFGDIISHEEAEITIKTNDRVYSKKTAVQYGISSLMGIYMTTSGCPIMEKLKPMVRFHLPFATLEETTYRAISMYLTSQYFVSLKGKDPDWSLKGLTKIYDDIRQLNKYFMKRLQEVQREDANVNAIGILGTFANFIKFAIDENLLLDIERVFSPYFED